MQFIKDNKLYIGIILLFAAGFWVYMSYFSNGSSTDLLTTETKSPLSEDVLVTLSHLSTIRLDESIFSDPVFTSLTNYGVAIPSQTAGRHNPFAPL